MATAATECARESNCLCLAQRSRTEEAELMSLQVPFSSPSPLSPCTAMCGSQPLFTSARGVHCCLVACSGGTHAMGRRWTAVHSVALSAPHPISPLFNYCAWKSTSHTCFSLHSPLRFHLWLTVRRSSLHFSPSPCHRHPCGDIFRATRSPQSPLSRMKRVAYSSFPITAVTENQKRPPDLSLLPSSRLPCCDRPSSLPHPSPLLPFRSATLSRTAPTHARGGNGRPTAHAHAHMHMLTHHRATHRPPLRGHRCSRQL